MSAGVDIVDIFASDWHRHIAALSAGVDIVDISASEWHRHIARIDGTRGLEPSFLNAQNC